MKYKSKKILNIIFDIPKKRINNTKDDYLKLLFLFIDNLNNLQKKKNIKIILQIWSFEEIKKLLNQRDYLKLSRLIKNANIKVIIKKIRISRTEKRKIEKMNNFILFYYFLLKINDKHIYSHIDLFFNNIPYNIPTQFFIWRNKRNIIKSKKFYREIIGYKIYIANIIHYRNINRKNLNKALSIIYNFSNIKNKMNILYKKLPKLIFKKFKHTKALYLMDKNPINFNKEFYFHFDNLKIYKRISQNESS